MTALHDQCDLSTRGEGLVELANAGASELCVKSFPLRHCVQSHKYNYITLHRHACALPEETKMPCDT